MININPINKQVVFNGIRTITNVYVSDSPKGTPKKSGRYIIINLLYGPTIDGASRIEFMPEFGKNVVLDSKYTIIQKSDIKHDGMVVISKNQTYLFNNEIKDNIIDCFKANKSINGLAYQEYKPTFDGKDKALIIWLHGSYECGDDNLIQILANKGASAFVQRKTQRLFGGAYVVAPQCPTNWMINDKNQEDYTQKIIDLVLELTVHHLDIDESRIYIGGCSTGGYQVWKTILAKPKMFAAGFMICPRYLPTKKELFRVKELPIWLIHSKDDSLVPVENSLKAHDRLLKMNGNVTLTVYPEMKIEGRKINGHFSWVPALNNYPSNAFGMHLFEWISKQTKVSQGLVLKPSKVKSSIVVQATATITGLGLVAYHLLKKKARRK